MTQTITQQQVEAAASNIMEGVYSPAFFQKLAELGHRPETQEDAAELLNLGFKLAAAGMQPTPTQPKPMSKYAEASAAFDNWLTGVTPNGEELRRKQAAAQLARDPAIYNAALILDAAEKQAAAEEAKKNQPAAQTAA